MKLKCWELSAVVAIIVTLFVTTALSKSQTALSDKLVRLHVVANSDSDEDQQLKLYVRDAVLDTLEKPLANVTTPDDAARIIENNFPIIYDEAMDIIANHGYNYDINLSLGTENFPTREYDTFSLPAGKYNSLRVEIGSGNGENWWCVVFPPMCSELALSSDVEAFSSLDEDEIKLIGEEEGYVIRFKCMELLSAIRKIFGK